MKTKNLKLAKTIGKNLDVLTNKKGYQSLYDLAQKEDLDESFLYRISRGELVPTVENLGKIAKVLNVTVDDLLKGYEF